MVRVTYRGTQPCETAGLHWLCAWHGRRKGLKLECCVYQTEYNSKLMTPADAVKLIPSRGTLSMGMAVSEPPALLTALEDRVKAGKIDELRVYYSHSITAAAFTILKYEYMSVIKPHPFFPTIDRAASGRAAAGRINRQRGLLHAGKFQRDAADAGAKSASTRSS